MNFYKLQIGQKSCVDYALGNDWEQITCSLTSDHNRAGKRLGPLICKMTRSKVVDFSQAILADVVISDNACSLMKTAGLTGYKLQPVHLEKGNIKQADNIVLWELILSGDGGFAHPESGIRLKTSCNACGFVRYTAYEHGLIVDEQAWDGSDFFCVREYPRIVLCSEKAMRFLVATKLTNIKFQLTTDLKWPDMVIKP